MNKKELYKLAEKTVDSLWIGTNARGQNIGIIMQAIEELLIEKDEALKAALDGLERSCSFDEPCERICPECAINDSIMAVKEALK